MRSRSVVALGMAVALVAAACASAPSMSQKPPAPTGGFAKPVSEADLVSWNIDVRTSDGLGLPAGRGSVAQGRQVYQAKCLECHGPSSPNGPRAAGIEAHTHHKSGSSGNECVACHMPAIEQTIADVNVRAHTFRFITPSEG